jgi:hypothetical protein
MSWNYRVVKGTTEDGGEYFGIHEIYYNDDGGIRSMSEGPEPVAGETLEAVKSVLQKMTDCLSKDVLVEGDIIFVDPEDKKGKRDE